MSIEFTPRPALRLQVERVGEEVIFSVVSTGEGFADFSDREAGDVIGRIAVPVGELRKELET